MTTKKDLTIVILATFCLTLTLFTILPAGSNNSTLGTGEYDPWIDPNDDGSINILDCIILSNLMFTTGTPINKTARLLELEARIDSLNATNIELQSKVDLLNASLLDLEAYFETRIDTLNATITEQQSGIAELESKIAVLNATKLGEPDWDSLDTYGWLSIPAGEFRILTHGLNTTNVIVYMVGYDFNGQEFHQIDYGGEKSGIYNWGASWSELTTTTIKVTRFGSDFNWDVIRVMVWKIPEP